MADPAMMSLDDYIKTQRKTGRMSFGRGGRGGGRGGRRGVGNSQQNQNKGRGRGGGRGRNPGGSFGRGNLNQFRGRRRVSENSWQQQYMGGPPSQFGNDVGQFGRGGGQGGQNQSRKSRMRNRNRNRSNVNMNIQRRRQRVSGGGGINQNLSLPKQQRYFSNPSSVSAAAGKIKRNKKGGRMRQIATVPTRSATRASNLKAAAATKNAFLKLAKKRVQRAKLLVSKKRFTGAGKLNKLLPANNNVGRVALGRNGFFTVRNTNAKRLERTMVKNKIARAQKARNRVSPQQQRNNVPGTSRMGSRSARRGAANMGARPSPQDWNTPIVRTMRNDLVDEMTTGHLNPEIQRKIAFIQSRSKGDRTQVMQDFKAPVTTSRMKLSDRFRLLSDR